MNAFMYIFFLMLLWLRKHASSRTIITAKTKPNSQPHSFIILSASNPYTTPPSCRYKTLVCHHSHSHLYSYSIYIYAFHCLPFNERLGVIMFFFSSAVVVCCPLLQGRKCKGCYFFLYTKSIRQCLQCSCGLSSFGQHTILFIFLLR